MDSNPIRFYAQNGTMGFPLFFSRILFFAPSQHVCFCIAPFGIIKLKMVLLSFAVISNGEHGTRGLEVSGDF